MQDLIFIHFTITMRLCFAFLFFFLVPSAEMMQNVSHLTRLASCGNKQPDSSPKSSFL